MQRNYLALHFILLIVCSNINAQIDSTIFKPRMKVTAVYVQTGYVAHNKYINTLNDFEKLAPQSVLLDSNFSGYSAYSNNYSDNAGFAFSALTGINFMNHQRTIYKSNPQLRLGISYMSGVSMSRTLRKEVTRPYDTLTSSQTGEMIFIDSVNTDSYSMRYRNGQLRLHVSLIFRTNPKARWSLYGGAGVTAGMSFNAHTEINYAHRKATAAKNNSADYFVSSNGDGIYTSEDFTNKSGFGFSAFIPLGIDCRLGNKREFWKRLHAYCELNPQIDVSSVPELRNYISSGASLNFGWRVLVD